MAESRHSGGAERIAHANVNQLVQRLRPILGLDRVLKRLEESEAVEKPRPSPAPPQPGPPQSITPSEPAKSGPNAGGAVIRFPTVQRLSAGPGPSRTTFNFARSVATDEVGRVRLVWHATHEGKSQVHDRRSDDGGANGQPDTPFSEAATSSEHPSIAVSGSNVFTVWHSFAAERKPHILMRRSTGRGATWEPPVLLCDSGAATTKSTANTPLTPARHGPPTRD